MKIKLLITGGTIDKIYNPLNGHLEFIQSNIEQMLTRSRTTLEISQQVLFLKDSLAFTSNDRKQILAACIGCDEDKIIITHGTDTMVKTAKLLAADISNKTVILFGAMVPFSVDNSDALFNFGVAFAAVQTISCGVYIAMNGRIFNPNMVQKNKSLGVFE